MKRAAFALLSIGCLLLPVRSLSAWTPDPLDGDWVGEFTIDGKSVCVRTRFETSDGATAATFDMALERPRRVALRQIRSDSAGVRFELPREPASLLFEGRLTGGALAGDVRQGDARGTFQLVRLAPVDLELYRRYAGSYQFGDKFIDIGPFSENENRLRFFDAATRRTGVLYAVSETEFFAGPSSGVAFPKDIVATFVRDERGEATGMTWREGASVPSTGKKADAYAQEEVAFQNGDVTLRGTLSIPASKGPHPAIVLIPGSGPARRPAGHWIPFFARQGIAVLVFDKRGAGSSTGDWMKSTYDDLAGDALAGVELLEKHEDIHPKQIGLWGNSEGGWVAPLAASRSSDIAFLMVRSGSALPVWQTVLHEGEGQLRDGNDLTEDEIRDALALKRSVERIALETMDWDDAWAAIDAAYQQARDKRWFDYVAVDQKDHSFWPWWRLRGGYDPAAALAKVRCPVLVLLGEVDRAVGPTGENAAAFEQAFRASGNQDYTIRILPKANHGLLLGETGFNSESPRLREYSPGYMDGMADWLLSRVK